MRGIGLIICLIAVIAFFVIPGIGLILGVIGFTLFALSYWKR